MRLVQNHKVPVDMRYVATLSMKQNHTSIFDNVPIEILKVKTKPLKIFEFCQRLQESYMIIKPNKLMSLVKFHVVDQTLSNGHGTSNQHGVG